MRDNNKLDVSHDAVIGTLEVISQRGTYVDGELILGELDRKRIIYKSNIFDEMVAARLLEPPKIPKTSKNKLYTMTEVGEELLEKEKSS